MNRNAESTLLRKYPQKGNSRPLSTQASLSHSCLAVAREMCGCVLPDLNQWSPITTVMCVHAYWVFLERPVLMMYHCTT